MQEKKRFLASTVLGYRLLVLRRVALSHWTPILAGVVLLGLHVAWAIRWEPTKRGEVVTGFGACLIVLGLLVAARPYLRAGRNAAADQAMSPLLGAFAIPAAESIRYHERREAGRPQVRRDVIAEREIAVGVIAVGTLLNGYGPPLVRWLGLEG